MRDVGEEYRGLVNTYMSLAGMSMKRKGRWWNMAAWKDRGICPENNWEKKHRNSAFLSLFPCLVVKRGITHRVQHRDTHQEGENDRPGRGNRRIRLLSQAHLCMLAAGRNQGGSITLRSPHRRLSTLPNDRLLLLLLLLL